MSYIKIYFGDKPVFLCDEITDEINTFKHHPDAVFIDELSPASIKSLLHEIDKKQFHAGILFNENFNKLKTIFFKHFTLIKAGGGLIKNKKGEILLISRRGKWDLPKGKLEDNETMEQCAQREVQEETGLKQIKLGKQIETTYHTYIQFGTHILKESHWFSMKTIEDEELTPQTEEDIKEIKWVKKEDLAKYTSNTFPSIIDVLKHA
jgi:8-oxo-dGTP pyrophosphatase MutT (NUDIX family)